MYMGVSLKVLLHVDVNGGSLFAESKVASPIEFTVQK